MKISTEQPKRVSAFPILAEGLGYIVPAAQHIVVDVAPKAYVAVKGHMTSVTERSFSVQLQLILSWQCHTSFS